MLIQITTSPQLLSLSCVQLQHNPTPFPPPPSSIPLLTPLLPSLPSSIPWRRIWPYLGLHCYDRRRLWLFGAGGVEVSGGHKSGCHDVRPTDRPTDRPFGQKSRAGKNE